MTQVSHQIGLFVAVRPSVRAAGILFHRTERDIKVENEATVVMKYPRGQQGQFVASSREVPAATVWKSSEAMDKITLF